MYNANFIQQETKVIFISRAVDLQPCFNRDVISELSDQATANLLDFAAWGEGERMQYSMTNGNGKDSSEPRSSSQDDADLDSQIYQAIAAGNMDVLADWAQKIHDVPDARQRITRAFLSAAEDAPDEALQLLLSTEQVDLQEIDEINHRNILHRSAISGRSVLLTIGLAGHVNLKAVDVYGRIPLHYACMHGSPEMVRELLQAGPDTIDIKDHDNFTPLIHGIVHGQIGVVQVLLKEHARINPTSDSDHIPLNLACQHGAIPIVQELLKQNPDILPDAEGLYPQHLVARSDKAPQLLLMLREYGADLDQPDKLYQWTPLFHAASEGSVQCLQTLLDSEADPRILDEKGLSALYYATWEGHLTCMDMLIKTIGPAVQKSPKNVQMVAPMQPPATTPLPKTKEGDGGIPLFVLPPPIIPIRRYGHNFLDTRTFVTINFENLGYDAIQFYDDNKYPAARLTISSKSSDLIPRNLLLPIQDDYRVSFQIDNLDTFAIDFDVYPTFGARVIARTVASSKVFTDRSSSSGLCHLELLDPRLRAIGRISFSFQVVKPFSGVPLEIAHFATYWKETDQQPHSSSLVTGSSLSGDYVRLFVQTTSDLVPVLFPQWKMKVYEGLEVPINSLTYAQFTTIGAHQGIEDLEVSHLIQAIQKLADTNFKRANSRTTPFSPTPPSETPTSVSLPSTRSLRRPLQSSKML
jgi:CDK inhibitor PHO81